LGVPWNTVDPKGILNFETRNATIKGYLFRDKAPVFQGLAELTLKDLSSRLSPLSPLGTYKVKLYSQHSDGNGSPSNPELTSAMPDLYIRLETTQGRLELSGEGKWSNKHLYFNGLAKAQAGFEAALANLLGVLGTRTDNTATLKIG
jgi:general secretion pathway protein N